MALLAVIHTATVCWDVYKVSIEKAQSRKTPKSGGRDGEDPRSPARKKGWYRSLGTAPLEQIKASRLLAAGPGSPVPDGAATIIREAGEMRLPPTPAFWPIT